MGCDTLRYFVTGLLGRQLGFGKHDLGGVVDSSDCQGCYTRPNPVTGLESAVVIRTHCRSDEIDAAPISCPQRPRRWSPRHPSTRSDVTSRGPPATGRPRRAGPFGDRAATSIAVARNTVSRSLSWGRSLSARTPTEEEHDGGRGGADGGRWFGASL